MYGKYLRVLLLAIRIIKMDLSGVGIFSHRSTYVQMNQEEVSSLLNSSLEYIAKWRFVARSLCNIWLFNRP